MRRLRLSLWTALRQGRLRQSPPIEIRKLATSRWEDYRRLRLESLDGSPLAFGSAPEEESGLRASEWKKKMKDTYFAMDGETPVGMVVVSFSEQVKFRHNAEIYSFYVRPAHRGKGVGKALLGYALGLAKEDKRIVKVRLYVNSQQRAAIRLYRSKGFAVTGTLLKEMKVGERFYTMFIMEKMIR